MKHDEIFPGINGKVKSIFVQEGYHYNRQTLEALLGLSQKSSDKKLFDDILLNLVKLNTLKIANEKEEADREELAQELGDFKNLKQSADGKWYAFEFVGVIVLPGYVFKCYPKYLPHVVTAEPWLNFSFKNALRAVEKYNSSKDKHNTWMKEYDYLDNTGRYNTLSLILFLLSDYEQYGLYNNIHRINEYNGDGDIDWDKTTESINPIISKERPYYSNLITIRDVDEEYNYFQRLHARVLTLCSKFLYQHKLFDVFDNLTPLYLSDEDMDCFGDNDYKLYRLEREIGQQFITHKQLVLKALYAIIKQVNTVNDVDNTLLYGSHSFYHIWEVVCAEVFDSVLKMPLIKLNLPVKSLEERYKDKKDKSIQELVDLPVWTSSKGGESAQSNKSLELDALSMFNHNGKWYFSIMDAKYYLMDIDGDRGQIIGKPPSIGDIEKQYFYQMACQEFAVLHNFDAIRNSFLMPIYGEDALTAKEAIYCGHASLPMIEKFDFSVAGRREKLKHINIIKLPPLVMLDWYLKGVDRQSLEYQNMLGVITTYEE